jgi:hypothetical protein
MQKHDKINKNIKLKRDRPPVLLAIRQLGNPASDVGAPREAAGQALRATLPEPHSGVSALRVTILRASKSVMSSPTRL